MIITARRFGAALIAAIKMAAIVLLVGGLMAYFGAPTLFGIAIITGGVAITVATYTGIAAVAGFLYRFFIKDRVVSNWDIDATGKPDVTGRAQ